MTIKITERRVANALYRWRSQGSLWLCCPNCHLYGCESDLLCVTGASLSIDHEIKLTRADFRNEFKSRSKHWKHDRLRDAFDKKPVPEPTVYVTRSYLDRVPNYFCFVTPVDLIKQGEFFPRYAGLIEFSVDRYSVWTFRIRRPPPLLHKNKLTDKQKIYVGRALMFRYFNASESLQSLIQNK